MSGYWPMTGATFKTNDESKREKNLLFPEVIAGVLFFFSARLDRPSKPDIPDEACRLLLQYAVAVQGTVGLASA